MGTFHKIINGDSRQMHELKENCMHLIVTSPPYWQLKDYGIANQIGFNDSYESYINNLNLVWKECLRVLHNGCKLCINIGDQYARAVYYGRYKVISIRTEVIRFCEHIGFDYMGAIIWQKSTTINTTGGSIQMGSYPFPRNGILKLDYEYVLVFKKLGKAPTPTADQKKVSILSGEEWTTFFTGHWAFPGVHQKNHIAMFPEELPRRLIKMYSFYGDNVLDPFAGSGTTSLVAKNLGRNSASFEINPDFIPIIRKKIGADNINSDGNVYRFIERQPMSSDFSELINSLPYIYKDPHRFNKKINLKKLQFGSKLDRNEIKNRINLFKVKNIVSPEKLILSDDLAIRLLGVKQKELFYEKAIEFIHAKALGKSVFLKFDNIKFDKDNNLLCYLFLEDLTFLNAELVKSGFVSVDESFEYKYKKKLSRISQLNKATD